MQVILKVLNLLLKKKICIIVISSKVLFNKIASLV